MAAEVILRNQSGSSGEALSSKNDSRPHEAEHLMGNLKFGDAARQDVRGAVQQLEANLG
jgi:hypothetical protein